MRLVMLVILSVLATASESIPAATIAAIDLSDARSDGGWVAPVSKSLVHLDRDPARRQRVRELMQRIDAWAPPAADPLGVFRRLNAAALADLGRSDLEAEVNWSVFSSLCGLPEREAMIQAAAAVVLGRSGGTALTAVEPTGLRTTVPQAEVEERIRLLGRKLLGRLLGTLPVR
jgi:hypothetical protein